MSEMLAPHRDPERVKAVCRAIDAAVTRPHTIMEICGGQTHAIMRYGLDTLLPEDVRLVHGPGCPVCVTPTSHIDQALALAMRPEVIFCSFGDMLRVPGSDLDLRTARAQGADVRIVYAPTDAVALARRHPDKQVVFFAIGFETTAPATAMAAFYAKRRGLENFSMMVSHVRVPPAMRALLSAPDNEVTGFLAAGHVCAVMGVEEYHPIAAEFGVPIVVTGFEPLDLLRGILACVQQLEAGEAQVDNRYRRAAKDVGNEAARHMLAEVFEVRDMAWRGLGVIPQSGLGLSAAYRSLDAMVRFEITPRPAVESPHCRAGEVLRGVLSPDRCEAFGVRCSPERPLGAPMVSSEGACAAYFRYRGVGERR